MDQEEKYKTEMCKNWIETGFCRYEQNCRFAHGQHELASVAKPEIKNKHKVCKSFHQVKHCMYGVRCVFTHEHRGMKQLHRHYYTP